MGWRRHSAVLLLASSSCAWALNPALDAGQYAHTPWKVREGFSKGTIVDITQTQDGYLWLGTEFGLLRFDGVRYVPWQPPANQHLPSNYIQRLLAGRDGTLWIGTAEGLASWKDGELTRYSQLAGQSVWALLEDREGTLWAAGQAAPAGKLCAIRGGKVQCYGEDGSFGQYIDALYEDRAGNLWVAGLTGLWRWKPGPPQLYPLPERVQAMTEGDHGALVIVMLSGIRQFSAGKLDAWPVPGGGPFTARGILRDRDGALWIGTTDRGLVHVHQGTADGFERSDGLSADFIERLFEDREGDIWVATIDGLDRFREFAVPTISVKQGLSNAIVKSVLAARDGSVWLGTANGLDRWDHGRITEYRKGGLPDDAIESLFQDDRERIWVATRRGVAFFENGRFTPVPSVPGEVHSIAGDREGNIWVSQGESLFRLRDGKVAERIPWAKLGRTDGVRAMAGDPQRGGLWLAFRDGGVAHFADGRVGTLFTAADGLGAGHVRDIQVDRAGAVWASVEGGLSRLKDGRIATLTSRNGLPCDSVHWVMEDGDHYWLYLACGLVRIARPELDAWFAAAGKDPERRVPLTVFDTADGVRSHMTTTGFSPSVAKSSDGRLWFLPWDGVSVVDPRHLPFNKLPPPVRVETVKIDGREQSPADRLKLSHRINDVEIDYTALSLPVPERVLFRYRLDGKDTEWHDAGTRRQAYYNGLAPREYRFRVMACNNDGVWNEAGAAWSFSIVPAFYQTIWFQGFAVLAGAGLVWSLYRLRLQQMTARLSLLHTERLSERTRIARELHDTLLQSLAGVSLQLHGISKQVTTAPEKTVALIGHVREQVDLCFREARMKVWNLRSPALEGQGLPEALREFVERIRSATTARCGFSVAGEPRPGTPEVEEELLRVAQEAVNNAIRHAQPNEIRVAVAYAASSLTLTISDDGRGFDFEEGYRKTGHWGLKNMQERAAQLRGKCAIVTAAGSGTRVEVRVPLPSRSARSTRAKSDSSSGSR